MTPTSRTHFYLVPNPRKLTNADNEELDLSTSAAREHIIGKTSSKPFIAVTPGVEWGPKYYHIQLRNITPNPFHWTSRGTEAANHPPKKTINQPLQYCYPQGVLIQDIRSNPKFSLFCRDLRRPTCDNYTELRENQEIVRTYCKGNTYHSFKHLKPVHKTQDHGKNSPSIIQAVLTDKRQRTYQERQYITTFLHKNCPNRLITNKPTEPSLTSQQFLSLPK